jgi:hypothetical protein
MRRGLTSPPKIEKIIESLMELAFLEFNQILTKNEFWRAR